MAKLSPEERSLLVLRVLEEKSFSDNSGTKKEGVSYTYKGMDGFAPMFAYLGQEGYGVNTELREGSQHCQNGTPTSRCLCAWIPATTVWTT
nr:hypothetical protein [Cohnella fermenti]